MPRNLVHASIKSQDKHTLYKYLTPLAISNSCNDPLIVGSVLNMHNKSRTSDLQANSLLKTFKYQDIYTSWAIQIVLGM